MKRALVTGINGQDGSYMADLLLGKGYKVFGMERRSSRVSRENIEHLINEPNFQLLKGDLSDKDSLMDCLQKSQAHEVYNFGGLSSVGESFNNPTETIDVNALGNVRLLECIKSQFTNSRFYQASSGEMFGTSDGTFMTETSTLQPKSPYAISKSVAYWNTQLYRSLGIYAVNGILFNHESERRGIEFVTRKITDGVARIALGLSDSISLGNLESKRDWGYAPDYVEAAWRMLQQDGPDDYVIATGETRSIREFLDAAFAAVDITDWTTYVKQDPRYFRPAEVDVLRGDYTKAKTELGWEPRTDFNTWVQLMVENDIHLLQQ